MEILNIEDFFYSFMSPPNYKTIISYHIISYLFVIIWGWRG